MTCADSIMAKTIGILERFFRDQPTGRIGQVASPEETVPAVTLRSVQRLLERDVVSGQYRRREAFVHAQETEQQMKWFVQWVARTEALSIAALTADRASALNRSKRERSAPAVAAEGSRALMRSS